MTFSRLALCGSLLLAACSSSKRKPEEGFYGPKQPKYLIEFDKENRKDGREIWWYQDGKKKYEAENRAGYRDGRFTAWHPNGAKWYEGFERNRKPDSTLTYWHPNGQMKSQALFRDGIQLERRDWDESGKPVGDRNAIWTGEPGALQQEIDENTRLRDLALRGWALRVRQTVETYWRPGKQFEKEAPHRTVAKITVDRSGKVLGVSWPEKSPSASFNSLAQQTFKKIKRMPEFPPAIKDETLDIQYEFVSQGRAARRTRLEAREPEAEAPPPPSE